ncbi:hypothetical protein [Kineococcus sp. SYSU DK005]|uniref:hypothetical protein n=1 Tax=Kineococcus sp. SYSU DK005 TaxID=3383126 RepID=UPI003D7DE8D4
MSHHDPHDFHDPADSLGAEAGTGADDPTVRRLRHGLYVAGRGVHAPAGIAAAALRGGRRRRRQRRAVIAAPVALVAVGAAGLGWAQPWDGGQVRTVPVAEQVREGQRAATTTDDVLAQLPTETGGGFDLGVAQQVLIDRCLAAQGLDVARGRVTLDASDPIADAARRGGDVEDLTAWTAHGSDYGLSSAIRAALASPGAGELGDYVHGIPAGYEQAVYGDPKVELTVPLEDNGSLTVATTGCYAQAVQQLYGTDVETYTRAYVTVRPLREQLLTQVAADETVQDATQQWSRCMQDRGHDVITPADLPVQLQAARRDLLLHKPDGSKATEADLVALGDAETTLARADRDCKDTSALGSAVAQALVEYGTPLASEHAGELDAYRAMVEHARVVAAEVNRH